MTPDQLRASIDTIVIVMMENRSFDHLLGPLRMAEYGGRTDIDGIDNLANVDWGNNSQNGTLIQPFLATDGPFTADLPHERAPVATQLAKSNIAGYTMTGFVRAYENATGTSGNLRPPPMGLLTPGQIPITSFLAGQFKICDRWFAPIPTSTHPNRLMAWSGYTLNDDTFSKPLPDQELFVDWLAQRNVRWRIYSAGLPFLTLMPKMWPKMLDANLFRSASQLANDVQNEPDGAFPQVIVVEPDYDDSPIHLSGHACDNHPPLPMAFGEMFLQHVYEALTSNPQRWQKTLLIVHYDEHGGFWDHVAPLPIAFPPPPNANFTVGFESTGPRVPGLLVSPWVTPRSSCSALFDHTSILQLLAERFGDEPYSAGVAARAAAGIQSLSVALDADVAPAPPPDLPSVNLATSVVLSAVKPATTNSKQAFAAAVDQFAQANGQAALSAYPAIAQWRASR
jgi:phospholipase C